MRMGVTVRVRVGMAVFVGVHKTAAPMLVDLLMHVFVGVAVRVGVLMAAAHCILRVEPFVRTAEWPTAHSTAMPASSTSPKSGASPRFR
jgi:hypothetical protein